VRACVRVHVKRNTHASYIHEHTLRLNYLAPPFFNHKHCDWCVLDTSVCQWNGQERNVTSSDDCFNHPVGSVCVCPASGPVVGRDNAVRLTISQSVWPAARRVHIAERPADTQLLSSGQRWLGPVGLTRSHWQSQCAFMCAEKCRLAVDDGSKVAHANISFL